MSKMYDLLSAMIGRIRKLEGTEREPGGNANQGTGLTSTEKNLMLTLFKAVPYQTDVSATMKTLEAIWSGGSSGGETPDIPDVTNYTVTYNLTSVTADSTPASVIEGGSLTVNLTPDTNAVLGEVIVTMGGVDVTATAYSNGKVSISSVTGHVVITATATVASYTQVEYLEANNTTYSGIVTNYVVSNTDLVEIEYSCTNSTTWAHPFCWSTGNASGELVTRFDGAAGRTRYTRRAGYNFAGTSNPADEAFASSTGVKYRFAESAPGTGTIYDTDGNALVTLTDESASTCINPGAKVSLFSFSRDGVIRANTGCSGLRIHSFKIRNTYGDVTLDIIPVLDSEGTPCMYDKISGEYYYCPSGNEYFTAGGAV